jgi:hypothetical protein
LQYVKNIRIKIGRRHESSFFQSPAFLFKESKKRSPSRIDGEGADLSKQVYLYLRKNLKRSEAENTPIKIFKDDYRAIVHCKNYNKRKRDRIQCYKFIRQ